MGIRKRLRRSLFKLTRFKLILIIGAFTAGYFYTNPDKIPHPSIKSKVKDFKQKYQTTPPQQTFIKVLGTASQEASQLIKDTKIPTKVLNQENLPEEIIVEDVVDDLTEQVKQLPQSQIKKVKIQFCQDIISEATQSAN